jgi:hypothetical protein
LDTWSGQRLKPEGDRFRRVHLNKTKSLRLQTKRPD